VIRLLDTEVRRLLARRMFRYLLLVGFGILVILGVFSFIHSSRNVAAAQAAARAEAVSQAAQFQAPPGVITRCKPPQDGGAGACKAGGPTADELYQAIYQDPRYAFADHAGNVVVGVVIAVSLLGFVLGAGFIGAEWGSGTMASLLTWEPRRLRVLAAKLLAAIAVLVVMGAVAIALGLAGAWLIAAARGTTAGSTSHVVSATLWRSGRGLLLIGLLTGAGAAIAGFTRHTVAALAATVGYLVIVELILRRFEPDWARWFLTSNAAGALAGRTRVFERPRLLRGAFNERVFVLHAGRGFLYLTVLLAALLAVWIVTFTRRDIDEGGGR
jgi:hypothetical protein